MIDDSADNNPLMGSGTIDVPGQSNQNVAPAQAMSGYGGIPNTVSRFGPSRFGGGQYGNDQFFGGSNTAADSQFSLSGFSGNSNAGPAVAPPPKLAKQPTRTVRTQDWMPWSLIAAGTVIVLYTKPMGYRE